MVKDETAETTGFSGKIYLTTLDGDYLNAYKIVDGVAVIWYKKREDKRSEDVYSRSSGEKCLGMACGVDLDAILLSGKGRGSNWFEDEEK